MYLLAYAADPIGVPIKRIPVVISCGSLSFGCFKYCRARWSQYLSFLLSLFIGECPFVEVRIFVFDRESLPNAKGLAVFLYFLNCCE